MYVVDVVVTYVCDCVVFFFFKQKTAYEMRISDWSSDVCSSDLHALLRAEWLQYFLDHCPAGRDVCVALARREQVLTAVPDTQRTWLRFADGHFSGCNMFYLATPAAAGVVQFWRSLEADRKHPLKMLRKIGPGSALCYLFGRLSLRNAVKHIGKRSGADRSEEHTSELQSLMRHAYTVLCLK